jgi:hypothetical protein
MAKCHTQPRWYGYRAAVTWGQPQKKRRSRWKTTCGADGRRQVVQEFFPTTNEEGNATKDEEERHQQQLKQQPQAQVPTTFLFSLFVCLTMSQKYLKFNVRKCKKILIKLVWN